MSGGRMLGDLLVERGLLTGGQLETALARQEGSGRRLGEVLVELGLLGEHALRWALAEQMDVPLVHPDPAAGRGGWRTSRAAWSSPAARPGTPSSWSGSATWPASRTGAAARGEGGLEALAGRLGEAAARGEVALSELWDVL